LPRGRDIAPEFGRPQRFAGFVQCDQPVLLGAYSNRPDFAPARADSFQAFRDRGLRSLDPNLRILFDMTRGQPFDRTVALLRERENFTRIEIEHQALGAVGAAIDSETKHE